MDITIIVTQMLYNMERLLKAPLVDDLYSWDIYPGTNNRTFPLFDPKLKSPSFTVCKCNTFIN